MQGKLIGGIVLVFIIVGALIWGLTASPSSDDAMMKKDDSSAGSGQEETMMKDDGAMMEKKGTYGDYSAEKVALAASEDVLIYFHAPWCPKCRALEAEITAGAAIPQGVHILKVDFDTATALRQKYGVTTQHTFVQVDAQGSAIQKFNDASTFAAVFARIK